MSPATHHALALNVYCHREEQQNRLLTEVLGPAAEEALRLGRLESFLFDRFDGRGPHVYAVLVAAGEAPLAAVRQVLDQRLAPFLEEPASADSLPAEEVLTRHEACRGKALCTLDRLEGMALPGSYAFAAHPASEYPFRIWSGMGGERELWSALSEQSLWAIGRLAAGAGRAMGPGLRWAASVDLALRRLGLDSEAYWRYHLGTLLPDHGERSRQEPAATAAELAPLVSVANGATFERIFELAASGSGADPRASRLVGALAAELGGERGYRALREVVHLSLKQLGLHLGFQIPLVVFAWRRSLPAGTSG